MKMRSIRAIFRRGGQQNQKTDNHQQQQQQQQTPEELSRASSVSSLNAEQKQAKGAFSKIRKGVSKERIDGDGKRNNDKKTGEQNINGPPDRPIWHNHKIFKITQFSGITKNNNKIPIEDDGYTKESLLQELQEMAEEKSKLALQLGEKNGQLSVLKSEISKLKVMCYNSVNNWSGYN